MFTIRNSEFIRFDSQGRSVERLELDLDTSVDLPGAQNGEVAVSGRVAIQGSIAWDISTGDFYGLQSDGTWCKQDGSGAYSSDSAQLNSIRSISSVDTNPEESEVPENELEPIRDAESR